MPTCCLLYNGDSAAVTSSLTLRTDLWPGRHLVRCIIVSVLMGSTVLDGLRLPVDGHWSDHSVLFHGHCLVAVLNNSGTRNKTSVEIIDHRHVLYIISRAKPAWKSLGPRRFTNVFDESKINRIRIFVMFWTEYGDSRAYSKYLSDNRCTHRGNPVTSLKLSNRTIHLLLFIAFAVALTFIMLFIFNLIFRPSSFIRFSSPLQCYFECFAERVQRINICDASFNRKMTLPRSGIRQVTGHVDRCRFTCRRCESVNVCVSRRAAWEERENVWKRW